VGGIRKGGLSREGIGLARRFGLIGLRLYGPTGCQNTKRGKAENRADQNLRSEKTRHDTSLRLIGNGFSTTGKDAESMKEKSRKFRDVKKAAYFGSTPNPGREPRNRRP
jgi:hypothetical protein